MTAVLIKQIEVARQLGVNHIVINKQNMGLAANDLIQREYSWEAIADKFLDFYQKYN